MNIQSINLSSLIKPVRVNQPSFGKRNYSDSARTTFENAPKIGKDNPNSPKNVYYYRTDRNGDIYCIGSSRISEKGSMVYEKKEKKGGSNVRYERYTGSKYIFCPNGSTREIHYTNGQWDREEWTNSNGEVVTFTKRPKDAEKKPTFYNIVLNDEAATKIESGKQAAILDNCTLNRIDDGNNIQTTFRLDDENETISLDFRIEKEWDDTIDGIRGYYNLKVVNNETGKDRTFEYCWTYPNGRKSDSFRDKNMTLGELRHYLGMFKEAINSPKYLYEFGRDNATNTQLNYVIEKFEKLS